MSFWQKLGKKYLLKNLIYWMTVLFGNTNHLKVNWNKDRLKNILHVPIFCHLPANKWHRNVDKNGLFPLQLVYDFLQVYVHIYSFDTRNSSKICVLNRLLPQNAFLPFGPNETVFDLGICFCKIADFFFFFFQKISQSHHNIIL